MSRVTALTTNGLIEEEFTSWEKAVNAFRTAALPTTWLSLSGGRASGPSHDACRPNGPSRCP